MSSRQSRTLHQHETPLAEPRASLALSTAPTSQIHHWSIPQSSSHLVPEDERGKAFNLFLVSYHDRSCPFHILTFTTPSPFNSGHTKSRGARETLGRRACFIYIHRNSALTTWNPDKKQLSAAPRGQSLLRVLMCEEKPSPSLNLLSSNRFPSQPGP